MTTAPSNRRRILHIATGIAAPWVLIVPPPWRLALPTSMLLLALAADLARQYGEWKRIERLVPGVYRSIERRGVSGATWLGAGYVLTVLLFDPIAAAGGILSAAIGDPAASLCGGWYGRRLSPPGKPKTERARKTWVGSIACFGVCVPVLWLLPGLDLAAATAGGAMAALVERRAGVLDNLLVPVAVAMLLGLWGA